MLLCPANSASTRTLTPLLANSVDLSRFNAASLMHLLGHKRAHTTERYAYLANSRLIKAGSLIDKAYG